MSASYVLLLGCGGRPSFCMPAIGCACSASGWLASPPMRLRPHGRGWWASRFGYGAWLTGPRFAGYRQPSGARIFLRAYHAPASAKSEYTVFITEGWRHI